MGNVRRVGRGAGRPERQAGQGGLWAWTGGEDYGAGCRPGGTARSRGRLTPATLQVWDALDRLLQDETKPLVGGKAEWTFPNRDPLCVLHYADVQVRRHGAPIWPRAPTFSCPASRSPISTTACGARGCPATRRGGSTGGCARGWAATSCSAPAMAARIASPTMLTWPAARFPSTRTSRTSAPQAVELNPEQAKQESVKSVEGTLAELNSTAGPSSSSRTSGTACPTPAS